MTRLVGLTGGISCGKSVVAAQCIEHGLPIVDCDAIARQCTRKVSRGFPDAWYFVVPLSRRCAPNNTSALLSMVVPSSICECRSGNMGMEESKICFQRI